MEFGVWTSSGEVLLAAIFLKYKQHIWTISGRRQGLLGDDPSNCFLSLKKRKGSKTTKTSDKLSKGTDAIAL